jgi:hypothetical protein
VWISARYVDLVDEQILDNRHVIASMIRCQADTPRIVDAMLWSRVFALQEEVLEDILRSVRQQVRLEEAPRVADPIQQKLAMALQLAVNRPEIAMQDAVDAINFVGEPILGAEVKELGKAFRKWQQEKRLDDLVSSVLKLRGQRGNESRARRECRTAPT